MNRKNIVEKLIKEGFSEKTLANMNDRQLGILGSRILSEQAPNPVTNVSKTDVATQTALKQQKKPFSTYESEIKEDSEDKELVIKRLKHKIEHEEDKQKVKDAKTLLAKMTSKTPEKKKQKEVAEEFKTKTEWLKSKGIIKDKEETTESSDVADPEDEKPENHEKKEKKDTKIKGQGGSEYEKRVSQGNLGFGLNEWVDKMVGKNVHPFTSKNEIMDLIQRKLNEQEVAEPETKTETGLPEFLTFDQIKNAGVAEPTTKPTTKPGTKPGVNPGTNPNKRPNPYQPGKGPNPAPKASKL